MTAPGFSRALQALTFLKNWSLVLLWMFLIFSASADGESFRHSSRFFEPFVHWLFPKMSQAHVELLHHVFRKGCHFTEYAVLALLCRHAIRNSIKNISPRWRWDEAGLALAIVFTYAAGDELHQVFVPSRTGQVSDIFVDVLGGIGGLGALWLFQKYFRPAEK